MLIMAEVIGQLCGGAIVLVVVSALDFGFEGR